MRNFKFLATAIVAVMLACVLAVASFAATTPFKDIDDKKNEALSDAVSLLNGLGVAKGTSETTFGTMEHVTRQQMAAFVYRLMKAGKSLEGGSNSTPFTDLEDSTYFGYISWANGTGVIKGTSETTFNPKGGIILQDAYTMVIRALGHEKEDFVYPFDYIDKAEELGLDENLDSVVNYTTKLTRGDVAIILYNAFFAETGKVETKQVETLIGGGKKWVLQKKTYNPTLAEDVYNLEVGTFEVRATPKYAFNEDKYATDFAPLCDEFDKDMLQLIATESTEPVSEFYCDFVESGLSGAADDYIMRAVKVFYTYTEKNNKKEIDNIYFVEAAHKVLETTSATISLLDGKEDNDFYEYTRGDKKDKLSDYDKADGKIVVGNESIYCFDAPYSYLEPEFSPEMTKDERLEAQNAKNLKLVDIVCLDAEKGTYSYYIDTDKPIDNDADIIINLQRVYSKGVYKLKFFDVDGDGIYEYAHYMPATYGFMDGDDNKYFATDMDGNVAIREDVRGSDIDVSFKPVIYYNEANVSGAAFEDGDMVLAYLNPEANMIEVITTIKPYRGFVNQVRPLNAIIRIDGQQFQSAYTWRIVEEFSDGDFGAASLYAQYHLTYANRDFFDLKDFGSASTFSQIFGTRTNVTAAGELFEVYAYKTNGLTPCILWYDHIEDSTISFGLDEIAIPVSDEENKAYTYTKSTFDAELGDVVHYAKVYFNGKVSYIPLDLEDMDPALDPGYDGENFNLAEVEDPETGVMAYLDKICKVSVNSKGQYTLIPLLHAYDEDEYVGVNKDSTVLIEDGNKMQYGMDVDGLAVGRINKVSGGRYELVDKAGETLLGDAFDVNGETVKYFNITGSTRFIIKNTLTDKDNEVEYLEFDQTTFKGTVESDLKNIQYILRANPDSTSKADLLLLYAEAEDFEFKQKDVDSTWRIVAASEIKPDEEGEYRHFYTLFDPYTGTVVEDVPGKDSEEKAKNLGEAVPVGTIIEIKNGEIDEDNDILGTIDTSESTGLVYITNFDTEEGTVSFVPVEAIESALEDGSELCCGDELNTFVELFGYEGYELDIDGEEFKLGLDSNGDPAYGALYYQVTDETVISVLKSEKAGEDAFEEGEFGLADASLIASGSKEYKCYNTKVLNKKQNYGTEYAEYIKAYVYASENAEDEDELPVAEFIIVVVNGDEELIFTDFDENFYPESHE